MLPVRTAAEVLQDLEQFGIRMGLENLASVLAVLGDPHRSLDAVLVAGTNGKGSTAAYLAAIARAAGYRVGLYSSPHLERAEERIRIAGTTIDSAQLATHLEAILSAGRSIEADPPTYFEAMTIAAFLEFRDRAVDLAVLEVGMGGRLDATNIVTPRLSVVTSIAFDHREWLGPTLDSIAREKAGIFRVDVPAVLAPQLPEAEHALVEVATRIGTPLVPVGPRLRRLALRGQGLAGIEMEIETEDHAYVLASTLAGEHQGANVATAVVAAEELARLGWDGIDDEAITTGIADCRWPGRLESIPLPADQGVVLLDAAHNPAGCEALARFLGGLGRPYTLLFGALVDKEIAGMLPPLAAPAHRVLLTRPPSPRAADPVDLVTLLPAGIDLEIEVDPARALTAALDGESELVVVCGSIFLVGEVRTELRRRFGVPAAI